MLTQRECSRIFSGLPYREGWRFYGVGPAFDMLERLYFYETLGPGNGNYIEFIGYPAGVTKGNALIVCISECAPIAAYGQTTFTFGNNFISHNSLEIETFGLVTDNVLKPLEQQVIKLLEQNGIEIIDKELASRKLPAEVLEDEDIQGELYFHGLFQRRL